MNIYSDSEAFLRSTSLVFQLAVRRPILFSAPMVRAILDGRKVQTRRVVKPQPVFVADPSVPFKTKDADPNGIIRCPYGKPGDLLTVKENAWMWCAKVVSSTDKTRTGNPKVAWCECRNVMPVYSQEKPSHIPDGKSERVGDVEYCWHRKPGRFLPAWASRITLELTAVRIERLQEISAEDAIAEGIEIKKGSGMIAGEDCFMMTTNSGYMRGAAGAIMAYSDLWNSINGPGSWDANPWVWVLSFRKV